MPCGLFGLMLTAILHVLIDSTFFLSFFTDAAKIFMAVLMYNGLLSAASSV